MQAILLLVVALGGCDEGEQTPPCDELVQCLVDDDLEDDECVDLHSETIPGPRGVVSVDGRISHYAGITLRAESYRRCLDDPDPQESCEEVRARLLDDVLLCASGRERFSE